MQIFVHKFNELNKIGLIVHRMRKGHRFTVSLKAPQKVQKYSLKNNPARRQGCEVYLVAEKRKGYKRPFIFSISDLRGSIRGTISSSVASTKQL